MRSGGNDSRFLKSILEGADRTRLHSQILSEKIGWISGDLAGQFGRIGSAAYTQKPRRRIVVQKRDEHFVDRRIGERAEQHLPGHPLHNFRNDLRFARSGRPRAEMEDVASNSSLNCFDLASTESA